MAGISLIPGTPVTFKCVFSGACGEEGKPQAEFVELRDPNAAPTGKYGKGAAVRNLSPAQKVPGTRVSFVLNHNPADGRPVASDVWPAEGPAPVVPAM
eukprot:gene22055-54981_t